HDTYIRSSYTRFLFLILGLYRQITNQEEVVLHGLVDANVQSVFDIIQPMLTGSYDLSDKEQPLEKNITESIISYIQSTFANYAQKGGDSIASSTGKSLRATFEEMDLVTDSRNAIHGFFIRLEKGKLGLQRAE